MVGYKFSKNDWVTPFFVIFRSVREILLVTVFCKHPVSKPDHEKHDLLQVISRTIFSRIEGFRVQYENQSLGIYWLLELMTISGSPGVVE